MEVMQEKVQIQLQHVQQMVGYQKRKLHFYPVILPELIKVWILQVRVWPTNFSKLQ
jgi:hypothetical protein